MAKLSSIIDCKCNYSLNVQVRTRHLSPKLSLLTSVTSSLHCRHQEIQENATLPYNVTQSLTLWHKGVTKCAIIVEPYMVPAPTRHFDKADNVAQFLPALISCAEDYKKCKAMQSAQGPGTYEAFAQS